MHSHSSNDKSRRKFIGTMAKSAGALGLASFAAPLATQGQNSSGSASGCPVVFFELGCKDLEKTSSFYTELFGWKGTPVPYASQINTQSTEGVQGQIVSLGHEPHQYVTFYIQVPDIEDALTRIESRGGKKIIGPIPLPDQSQFAWFKDPEGNMVALISKP